MRQLTFVDTLYGICTIYLKIKDRGLGVSNSILFHRMFLENAQVFYIQRGIAYENCWSKHKKGRCL